MAFLCVTHLGNVKNHPSRPSECKEYPHLVKSILNRNLQHQSLVLIKRVLTDFVLGSPLVRRRYPACGFPTALRHCPERPLSIDSHLACTHWTGLYYLFKSFKSG